jgi:hypothetical protein
MSNNLMDPIEGVAFETYAKIMAEMAQGATQPDLLKKYGIENVAWEKACNGWADRMREDTSFSLVTEYGKYFMQATTGQFSDTAKEAAEFIVSVSTQSMKGDEPMSLEQYVEIQCAQTAAMMKGKDSIKVLESYGINAADYGTVGIYWSSKMMNDPSIGIKFSELTSKYEKKFSADAGNDLTF